MRLLPKIVGDAVGIFLPTYRHFQEIGRQRVNCMTMRTACCCLLVLPAILLPAVARPNAVHALRSSSRLVDGHIPSHTKRIFGMAWSPDGKTLATGAEDATAILWDPETGAAKHVLIGHREELMKVAWSPDGRILATQAYDGTIRLWNPATGALREVLAQHQAPTCEMEWSPDGKTLAFEDPKGSIAFWSPANRQLPASLHAPGEPRRIAWSPDGSYLAATCDDHVVRVWNAHQPQAAPFRFRGFGDMAWSPDGRTLAAAMPGSTLLWDRSSLRVRSRLEMPALPPAPRGANGAFRETIDLGILYNIPDSQSVTWSPDGRLLATLGRQQELTVWDPLQERCLRALPQSMGPFDWSKDGRVIACQTSMGPSNDVLLWDPRRQDPAIHMQGHQDGLRSIAWSPGIDHLATAAEDGTVRIWDRSGRLLSVCGGHSAGVGALAWSPDGSTIAASYDRVSAGWSPGFAHNVLLWDPRTGQPQAALPGHGLLASPLSWSGDGRLLATTTGEGEFMLWEPAPVLRSSMPAALRPARTVKAGGHFVGSLDWSGPHGSLVIGTDEGLRFWGAAGAGSQTMRGFPRTESAIVDVAWIPGKTPLVARCHDGSLWAWDAISGKLLGTVSRLGSEETPFAIDPTGRLLAAEAAPGQVAIRTPALKDLRTLDVRPGSAISFAWRGSGKQLAICTSNGSLQIWNTRSWQREHVYPVTDLFDSQWSRDGRHLVSVSFFEEVTILDANTGKKTARIPGRGIRINAFAWRPDGRELALGGLDGMIRFLDLDHARERLRCYSLDGGAFSAANPPPATAGPPVAASLRVRHHAIAEP